jgi:hypothetical protein
LKSISSKILLKRLALRHVPQNLIAIQASKIAFIDLRLDAGRNFDLQRNKQGSP